MRRRVRRPLCEMDAERFDALACVPSIWWIGRGARRVTGLGPGEWAGLSRSERLLSIAELALQQPSTTEVHQLFMTCLSGSSVGLEVRLLEPAPRRNVGRPNHPTRETATRVWTIDCLRALCGMTFDEAAIAWSEQFPELQYAPAATSTNPYAAYNHFRSERTRVRSHLDSIRAEVARKIRRRLT
jgi:hypothetical protein